MEREAAKDARLAGADPSWAYARVALRWAERYYANERELALQMIKDLDEAEAEFPRAARGDQAAVAWPEPRIGTRSSSARSPKRTPSARRPQPRAASSAAT